MIHIEYYQNCNLEDKKNFVGDGAIGNLVFEEKHLPLDWS